MPQLVGRRRGERGDVHVPGVEGLDQPLDGATLPGRVPALEVVVGEVPVLVVRRVQVRQVEVAQRRSEFDGIALDGAARTAQQLGYPQLERLGRAGRPLLHVRHLHAGGRVDPVRRLDEGRQEEGEQRRPRILRVNGVAHGIYPSGIVRLEVAGLMAERLRDVAGFAGDGVEVGDRRPQRTGIGDGGVGLDVGAGEGVRIAGAVDGGDVDALGLEGLGDAGGAGEEVERGGGAGGLADAGEDGDETALRADVLDHRDFSGHGGPPYDGRSWRLGTIQKRPGWVRNRVGVRVGGSGAGEIRAPIRIGCAGMRRTRIRRRTCRSGCGRSNRWCVPHSMRSRIPIQGRSGS